MKLKDYLNFSSFPASIAPYRELSKSFFDKFQADYYDNNGGAYFYSTYFYRDKLMNKFGRFLCKYPLELRCDGSRHPKNFFCSSFFNYKINHYISKSKHEVTRRFCIYEFRKFDFDVYYDLCKMVVAMLVQKYNYKSLFSEHILYQCICYRFYAFVEAKYINFSDIRNVYYKLLETDLDDLYDIAKVNGFYVESKTESIRKLIYNKTNNDGGLKFEEFNLTDSLFL